jgi:hypothetical protein
LNKGGGELCNINLPEPVLGKPQEFLEATSASEEYWARTQAPGVLYQLYRIL